MDFKKYLQKYVSTEICLYRNTFVQKYVKRKTQFLKINLRADLFLFAFVSLSFINSNTYARFVRITKSLDFTILRESKPGILQKMHVGFFPEGVGSQIPV